MKYLGVDYGTKRTGVAVSSDDGAIAFPRAVIETSAKAAEEIAALAEKEAAEGIILGESRGFDRSDNPVMKNILRFKEDLERASGLPVYLEDETLTSALARRNAPEKKGEPVRLDASAAALILQGWLDRRS